MSSKTIDPRKLLGFRLESNGALGPKIGEKTGKAVLSTKIGSKEGKVARPITLGSLVGAKVGAKDGKST